MKGLQIPPVSLKTQILVRTFGISFTSSLSFKCEHQKDAPIVQFIFRDTAHDHVIDRASDDSQILSTLVSHWFA